MQTCDSQNVGLKLINQIHHQQDPIIEPDICTWAHTMSRFVSNWRSMLHIARAKLTNSNNTKRKNGNGWFTQFRLHIDHPDPPSTRTYYTNSTLHMVQHNIKQLVHLTAHTVYQQRKTVNINNDQTQKNDTRDSFYFGSKLITQIHNQHDNILETQICTWYNTILKNWFTWRYILFTNKCKTIKSNNGQTQKMTHGIHSILVPNLSPKSTTNIALS